MNSLKKYLITFLLVVTVTSVGLFFGNAVKISAVDGNAAPMAQELSVRNRPDVGILSSVNDKYTVKTISSDVASTAESSSDDGSSKSDSSEPEKETEVTVGNVTKLASNSLANTSVTLTWNKVAGANGYVVYYRNMDGDKKLLKAGATKSTTYTVSGLKNTTFYRFLVRAYKVVDNKNVYGNWALLNTSTKPANVSGLKLQRSTSLIQIAWTKNSKSTGYEVYRWFRDTHGKYIKYKTLSRNTLNSLQDTKVEKGVGYAYRVRAYRKVGNKVYYGAFSTIYAVGGLTSPSIKSVTSQINKISISWNKVDVASGYDVYIAKQDEPYKLIGSTKNTFFNTDKYKTGLKCSIKIVPYKNIGSKPLRITGTASVKSVTVTNKAFDKNVGTTYIEVSIDEQKMWFYLNGKLYVETPVVTGMKNGYNDTPKGAFPILQRQSPATLVGADYVTVVNYWLGFTYSGCGVHDSTWRGSGEYGGNTYTYNGSHGCVNTPFDAVKKIYDKARVGMYVVVH